jgi:hypothetical protein
MLTARDARRDTGRRRAEPSDRQRYDEYVMTRIEQFKDSMGRHELMQMASEAVAGMDDGPNDQFVLTEIVMTEQVDTLIKKRLRLPRFKTWQRTFPKRRAAQQEPTHWGLDRACPLVSLLGRVEPGDRALVVGKGAEPCAYLLSAHDADVRFWSRDLGVLERVEQKVADEGLSYRFLAVMVGLDGCIYSDGAPYDIIVLDTGALAEIDVRDHPTAISRLQELTAEGGVHVLLSSRTLVPEAVYSFYGGWERESPAGGRRAPKLHGTVLVKPYAEEVQQAERA